MADYYACIIVFGWDGAQAQAVAAAIALESFHHVAYVAGTFETLLRPTASSRSTDCYVRSTLWPCR